MLKRTSLVGLALLLSVGTVSAQQPFNVAVPVDQLSTIFTTLYGPDGLIVDSLSVLPSGETHSAHFNSDFQSQFTQFGVALTSQLGRIMILIGGPMARRIVKRHMANLKRLAEEGSPR